MYRSGPFHKGKPEQGYQLALTPREFFAAGIAATNAWSRKDFGGKDLDRLAANDRVTALKAMEEGKAGPHPPGARLPSAADREPSRAENVSTSHGLNVISVLSRYGRSLSAIRPSYAVI